MLISVGKEFSALLTISSKSNIDNRSDQKSEFSIALFPRIDNFIHSFTCRVVDREIISHKGQ